MNGKRWPQMSRLDRAAYLRSLGGTPKRSCIAKVADTRTAGKVEKQRSEEMAGLSWLARSRKAKAIGLLDALNALVADD